VQASSGRFVIDGLTQESSLWTLHKILEDKTTIHPDRQKSMSFNINHFAVTIRLLHGIIIIDAY
jgi:hypothetical protein